MAGTFPLPQTGTDQGALVNRIELLKEMGITPVWKLRDAVAADAGDTQFQASDATKPLVQADVGRMKPEIRIQSASSGSALSNFATPGQRPALRSANAPALAPAEAGERAAQIARMEWPQLKEAVAACQACGLCQGRSNTVFGSGDERAKWMIIGEAPGQEEDRLGEPFTGQAGKLLDSMLAALDLQRHVSVYIANVLKCRPPGNRDPQPAEVAACAPHLERQIALLQPQLIVLMGRFAAQTILQTDASIASLRGRVFTYRGTPAIVTYHPAYLLRSLTEKAKAWEDLLFARRTFAQPPVQPLA